jgi:hypothetical protein
VNLHEIRPTKVENGCHVKVRNMAFARDDRTVGLTGYAYKTNGNWTIKLDPNQDGANGRTELTGYYANELKPI